MASSLTAPVKQESILARLTRKSVARTLPLNAYIELTYRCNLKCVHCYCVEDDRQKELSTEEFKNVLDQLADAGCLVVTFTGGEVFVRRDFMEIAEYAKRKRFAIRFYTNATFIDEKKADWIKELGAMEVEVSLYGSNPGVYEDITLIPKSYEKCIRGVQLLLERGVRVNLKTPVMTLNVHDYREIINIANGLDVDYSFDVTIAPKDNGDRSPIAYRIDNETLRQVFSDGEFKKSGEGEKVEQTEVPFCHIGESEITVSPYGEVFPCIQLRKPLGSLREKSFEEIWLGSKDLNEIRDLNAADFSDCGGCEKVSHCGRCPGLAMIEDGDMLGKSSWACNVADASIELTEESARGSKPAQIVIL